MLIFNALAINVLDLWKNLNTSHVNLQRDFGDMETNFILDLNTSHVNLQLLSVIIKVAVPCVYLNTSHVNLQP